MSIEVSSNPIFIIGSPRSGTSILAWSLAQHTQLWTASEFYMLVYLFGDEKVAEAFRKNETETLWCWLREQRVSRSEFLKYLGLGINALMTSRSHGKRWIEQTPAHTLMAQTLAEMFPDAFFLHILRDGRRVVNSLLNWNHPKQTGNQKSWEQAFSSACGIWTTHVEAALDFCTGHPQRSMTIVHERLAASPQREFSEIFRRLRVSYEESASRFLQSNIINSSFQSATHIPHKVEPWKQWRPEQTEMFLQKAGSTMEQYRIVQDNWYSLRRFPAYQPAHSVQR